MYCDLYDVPTAGCDVQVFNAGSQFQLWRKPRNKHMIFAIAIGSGSGGGGGFTAAIGTVRGGGGGGASGAIARVLIPAMFVPDTLYVQVGRGGAGGAASGAGGAGARSYISIDPTVGTAAKTLLQSGAAAATGGAAGSAAGSAAAGVAETISTTALCILSNMGINQFIAGKIGSIGGVVGGGAGASNTILTSHVLNGGAGGGTTPAANTEFAGGAQTGAGLYPTIVGGTAGGNPGHGAGGSDTPLLRWLSYGGAGGGTGGAAGTVGGDGGGGGIGSGGGGGGGGVTGGRGGRGGDGLVAIISF